MTAFPFPSVDTAVVCPGCGQQITCTTEDGRSSYYSECGGQGEGGCEPWCNGAPGTVEAHEEAIAAAAVTGVDARVTVVATVRVYARGTEAATAAAVHRLRDAVLEVLAAHGAELLPCDWAPDGDTITDAVGGGSPVTVLDLNPSRT